MDGAQSISATERRAARLAKSAAYDTLIGWDHNENPTRRHKKALKNQGFSVSTLSIIRYVQQG